MPIFFKLEISIVFKMNLLNGVITANFHCFGVLAKAMQCANDQWPHSQGLRGRFLSLPAGFIGCQCLSLPEV